MESKTPICDRWEYDTNQGGLVVPLNVAKDLEIELAEARAEIGRLEDKLLERDEEVERQDKLIEQMREALKLAFTEARSTHCENTIKAALEAAERE